MSHYQNKLNFCFRSFLKFHDYISPLKDIVNSFEVDSGVIHTYQSNIDIWYDQVKFLNHDYEKFFYLDSSI